MEDIDRTFEKLKREDATSLFFKLKENGKISICIDPVTFLLSAVIHRSSLNGTGWSSSDFVKEMKKQGNDYKVIIFG